MKICKRIGVQDLHNSATTGCRCANVHVGSRWVKGLVSYTLGWEGHGMYSNISRAGVCHSPCTCGRSCFSCLDATQAAFTSTRHCALASWKRPPWVGYASWAHSIRRLRNIWRGQISIFRAPKDCGGYSWVLSAPMPVASLLVRGWSEDR